MAWSSDLYSLLLSSSLYEAALLLEAVTISPCSQKEHCISWTRTSVQTGRTGFSVTGLNFDLHWLHLGRCEQSSLGRRLPPGTFLWPRASSVKPAEVLPASEGGSECRGSEVAGSSMLNLLFLEVLHPFGSLFPKHRLNLKCLGNSSVNKWRKLKLVYSFEFDILRGSWKMLCGLISGCEITETDSVGWTGCGCNVQIYLADFLDVKKIWPYKYVWMCVYMSVSVYVCIPHHTVFHGS